MPKDKSFKDFMSDCFKDSITPLNNPECKNCNECCSMGTLLTTEEYEKLKKFLKKSKHGRYLYESSVNMLLEHLRKGTVYWMCPFSRNKKCVIYNKRPAICKEFHCDNRECQKVQNNPRHISNNSPSHKE